MKPRSTALPGALFAALLLGAMPIRIGRGEPEPERPAAGETIAWVEGLPEAFERAAADEKVLLICINARSVAGEREEPAAKGLREIVYRDPAVVERSREFVCVLLTAEGSSEDYGELRYRFGIDGNIVSPQHIFARPDHETGARPLLREEFWSYGSGERAVSALIDLMDEALAAYRKQERLPDAPPDPGPSDGQGGTAPASGAERAAWIEELLELIRGHTASLRRRALEALVTHDREGDCVRPLLPLLDELEQAERTGALVDVVRGLGIPGLEAALPALHELLKHKDIHVRASVAVTLEYIGSAASTEPLLACVKREKAPGVAHHMYRAIGRCGAGDAAARRGLLRRAKPGKEDDLASLGPVIGLAYAEGDAKVARALERQLLKLGPPFQEVLDPHAFLRVLLLWCLGEIRDPATASFVSEKILGSLEDVTSSKKEDFARFCAAVARRCEGDDVQPDVDAFVTETLRSCGVRTLADRARRGRDMSRFVPKGEWGNQPKKTDD